MSNVKAQSSKKCQMTKFKSSGLLSILVLTFGLWISSAYAGDHGLGRGGMRNSGWRRSGDTFGSLRRISLPGG